MFLNPLNSGTLILDQRFQSALDDLGPPTEGENSSECASFGPERKIGLGPGHISLNSG